MEGELSRSVWLEVGSGGCNRRRRLTCFLESYLILLALELRFSRDLSVAVSKLLPADLLVFLGPDLSSSLINRPNERIPNFLSSFLSLR